MENTAETAEDQRINAMKNELGLYVCDFEDCKKVFKAKKSLIDHIRIHKGEKPFVCYLDSCKKKFTQYSSLQKHERIHRGEKPYLCESCGQSFSQISNLKRHERLHRGERPHYCEICDKKFATSSNLKQHMQVHEVNKIRNKFSCEICGRAYYYNSSLKKHMKEHELGGGYSSQTRDRSSSEIDGGDAKKYTVDNLKNFIIPQKSAPHPEQALTDLFYGIFDPSQIMLTPDASQRVGGNQLKKPLDMAAQLSFQQQQNRLLSETDPNRHDHSEICGHIKINYKGLIYYLHNQKLCRTNDGKVEIKEIEADETNLVDCRPVSEVTHIPNYNGILKMFKTTVLKYPDTLNMSMMLSSDNCNGLHCGCSNQAGESFKSPNSNFRSYNKSNEAKGSGCCQTQKAKNDQSAVSEENAKEQVAKEVGCCAEHSTAKEEVKSEPSKKSCCKDTKPINTSLDRNNPQPAGNKCRSSEKMVAENESQALLKKEESCSCNYSMAKTGEIHKGCRVDTQAEKYKLCLCSVTKDLRHRHSLSCGHPQISHNGHLDYIVDGRLHYHHGDHCDDHGPIEANNRVLFEETNSAALDSY